MFALAVFWLPSAASAQGEGIKVVQQKPVLQKGRFELVPRIGFQANEPLYRQLTAGGAVNYHISESFFVGASFDWGNFRDSLGGTTHTFDLQQDQVRALPDTALTNWVAGVPIGYKAALGKLVLFQNTIFYYDWALKAGPALVDNQSLLAATSDRSFGAQFGLESRIFLNKWLALRLGIRDVVFQTKLEGKNQRTFNAIFVNLGLGMYLPTSFSYSE